MALMVRGLWLVGGVGHRVSWGDIPRVADMLVAVIVAKGSDSEMGRGRRTTITGGVFCFFWWERVYDITALPSPVYAPTRCLFS